MADDLKLKLEIDSFLNSIGLDEAKAKIAALEAQTATAVPEVEALGAATASLATPLAAATIGISLLLPQIISWISNTKEVTDAQKELARSIENDYKALAPFLERLKGTNAELEKMAKQAQGELLRKQVGDIEAAGKEINRLREIVQGYKDDLAGVGQNLLWSTEAQNKANEALRQSEDELAAAERHMQLLRDAQHEGLTLEQFLSKARTDATNLHKSQLREETEAEREAAREKARIAKQEQADIKRGADFERAQELDFIHVLDQVSKKEHAEYLKRLKDQTAYLLAVKKLKETEIEIEKRVAREKAAVTQETIGYIGQALDALSSAFGNNKALAIAGAIVDTWAGAARALGPEGPPWPANIAAAAMIATNGLAMVMNIEKASPGFDDPFADLTARRLGRKSAVDFVSNFGSEFIPGVSAGMQSINSTTINRGTTINMGGIHGALGPRPAFDKWLERAMSKAVRMRGRTTIGR